MTLFGQSSGGGSVHYQMISESSRNLFHQAILMAGSALHSGYSVIPRLNWAQRLSARLGFNSTSDSDILNFLENSNPVDIITEQLQLLTIEDTLVEGIVIPFGPTIEPFNTNGVFLNDQIPTLVQNAWGNNINMLIGATSFEALAMLPILRTFPEIFDMFANFESYVPRELNVSRDSEESKKYAEMLKETYYGKLASTMTNIDGILFVGADNYVWFPAHRTVRYRLESGSTAQTYIYRFDADSENNVVKNLTLGLELYREPVHSDDFAHLFKTILHRPLTDMNEVSYNTLQLMVSLFTTFAKTGAPGGGKILWPSVESQVLSDDVILVGLNIKENSTEFMTLPEAGRVKTFDKIFDMERNDAATFHANVFMMFLVSSLLKCLLL